MEPGENERQEEGLLLPAASPKMGQRRSRYFLWMILLTLLLAGTAFCTALVLRNPASEPQPSLAADPNVQIGSLKDPAQRQGELDQIVDEGLVTFSINATPCFPDGTAEGNLMIGNPPENRNRFTVAIYRKDTGDKIYQSGYLDPEQYIESAPLDVELEKGTYECTAVFETYRLTDSSYIGQAAAEITVYVLN